MNNAYVLFWDNFCARSDKSNLYQNQQQKTQQNPNHLEQRLIHCIGLRFISPCCFGLWPTLVLQHESQICGCLHRCSRRCRTSTLPVPLKSASRHFCSLVNGWTLDSAFHCLHRHPNAGNVNSRKLLVKRSGLLVLPDRVWWLKE